MSNTKKINIPKIDKSQPFYTDWFMQDTIKRGGTAPNKKNENKQEVIQ